MTSTITNFSSTIDTAFPMSGRDNDTAGFRNNFIGIKNSLDIAAREISSLQILQESSNAQIVGNSNNIANLQASFGAISSATIFVPTAPTSSKGNTGDTTGMIHANTSSVFVCYGDYDGFADIWAKINTVGSTWSDV